MDWLSGLGAIQPVSSQITSAGHTWSLWRGPNQNCLFFKYLIANQGVASTQFMQAIQVETERFTGTANLVTSSYNVSLQ
ncbi:hypothetical protein FPV67DRAFT_1680329 [Lyophyllum atratum]|nr:hypothetical protein FPV67DRAFT_1680329 [Lyophyllum atratum]